MFSIWSIKNCNWMNSRELQLHHWSVCSNNWRGSQITQVKRCNLLHWTKESPASDESLGTDHPEIKIHITVILWIHLDYLAVCCLFMSQNGAGSVGRKLCAPNLCGKECNFYVSGFNCTWVELFFIFTEKVHVIRAVKWSVHSNKMSSDQRQWQ